MGCEDLIPAIWARADGALDDAARDALDRHLEICDACRARAAEVGALQALLGLDRDVEPPASFAADVLERARRPRRAAPARRAAVKVLAAAAATALLVTALVFVATRDASRTRPEVGPGPAAPAGFEEVERAVLADPELLDILNHLETLDDLELLENLPVLEQMDAFQAGSADALAEEADALLLDPELPFELDERD